MTNLILLSGNANPPLAHAVANILQIPLGKMIIDRFNDGETLVKILANINHKDIVIMQATCPPVNDNLMELILIANAAYNASANSITAVMPYFGYARQNKIAKTNVESTKLKQLTKTNLEPNSAKCMAKILAATGITNIITLDIHHEKILTFFTIPCTNLHITTEIVAHLQQQNITTPTIIAPDQGSIIRAKMLAAQINKAKLAIFHKHRITSNNIITSKILGKIKQQDCVLIDDLIDSAHTICATAKILQQQGARNIIAYCTHPVLSGNAIQNIENSALTKVIVTDTIQLSPIAKNCPKIQQISIAHVIAKAIKQAHKQYY